MNTATKTSAGPPLALVTGASSGIGSEAALALAADGFRVVLCARGRERLEEVRDRIAAAGGTAYVEPCDAGDEEQVAAMAERVRTEYGVPDAIINSAGAGRWLFVEETDPGEALSMMRAPYLAAFFVTKAFMPDLLARRSGVILSVQSAASRFPVPGGTGYNSARFALRGFHESLRLDLVGTGVRSVELVLGKVASPYFENNPGVEDRIPGAARVARTLTPEECGREIVSAVRHPKPVIIRPFMMKMFVGMNAVTPGMVRWLASRTGKRH